MEVSLATPLESRDGTLAKDAKLLNCWWELGQKGQKRVVKRPGLTPLVSPSAGIPQGLVSQGVSDFALIGDTLYQIILSGLLPMALPGVTVPNQRMTILNSTLLANGSSKSVIKSMTDAWVMTSIVVPPTKIVDTNFPALTVPGCVFLDGTYYVMTPSGQIYGSNIDDPLTWNPLNSLQTDRGLGPAVALFRHLNYIVAFCQRGIQFFYNANNPYPGSALGPVPNATSTIGCAHADSLVELNGSTYFMAVDRSQGKTIAVIQGLTISFVSDEHVNRILEQHPVSSTYTTLYSMPLTIGGKTFYILNYGGTDNLTLVLDVTLGSWAQWSTSPDGIVDNAFGPGFLLSTHAFYPMAFLDRTSGMISYIGQGGTELVHFLSRTRPLDAGSSSRKFLSELSLIGDTAAVNVQIRYSDDDAATWSAWVPLDMSTFQKKVTRLGSFYRRIFEFSYYGTQPLRIESMVLPDRNLPSQSQPEGE